MSYLDRIVACNACDLRCYRPFAIGETRVGWLHDDRAALLDRFDSAFAVTDEIVTLDPALDHPEARSAALAEIAAQLADRGEIDGLRGELYPVNTSFAEPPLAVIDRGAVPYFGLRAYGIHMNGFVRDGADGDDIHMWIGRRAKDRPVFPGHLDNMVAGGQPVGLSLIDNLVKEAAEEAAIPEALARRAIPVGAITYCVEFDEGIKPDVQFCYDLELPADFIPTNTDGEIDDFYLWPIDRVADIVRDTEEFKFNCNLVIIDFLVRHGHIPPDHADYLAIARGLRQ